MDQPIAPVEAQVQSISGIVVDGGIVCPLLKLADGRVYALQGAARADAPVGLAITVSGMLIAMSTCQQGDAFLVTAITTDRNTEH